MKNSTLFRHPTTGTKNDVFMAWRIKNDYRPPFLATSEKLKTFWWGTSVPKHRWVENALSALIGYIQTTSEFDTGFWFLRNFVIRKIRCYWGSIHTICCVGSWVIDNNLVDKETLRSIKLFVFGETSYECDFIQTKFVSKHNKTDDTK